jgi:hypothetical protein
MNRLLLKMQIAAAAGSLLVSNLTFSQILPPAKKAAHVEITQGPKLEFAREDLAIIRWTTNNPGGSDEHFGVVYYGTDPRKLSLMAKSHIRLNREHPETIFRVRVDGLKPRTTYYYVVTAIESSGKSDEFRSPINQFTTAAPGKRIVADPPQAVAPPN